MASHEKMTCDKKSVSAPDAKVTCDKSSVLAPREKMTCGRNGDIGRAPPYPPTDPTNKKKQLLNIQKL